MSWLVVPEGDATPDPRPRPQRHWSKTELRRLAHHVAAAWIESDLVGGAEIETWLGDDVSIDDPVARRFAREIQAVADKLHAIGDRA